MHDFRLNAWQPIAERNNQPVRFKALDTVNINDLPVPFEAWRVYRDEDGILREPPRRYGAARAAAS